MKKKNQVLIDSFGRVVRKLRLSVVDKCNFRCSFCMPDQPEWLPNDKVLTLNEISRLVTILTGFGVDRIRVTGGEPLIRKDIVNLVSKLSEIPGVHALGMTTNGYFLAEKASQAKRSRTSFCDC